MNNKIVRLYFPNSFSDPGDCPAGSELECASCECSCGSGEESGWMTVAT